MQLTDFTVQYNIEYFEMKSTSEYSYCKVIENGLWGIFKISEDSAIRVSESKYSSISYIEVFADNIKLSGFIVSKNQMQGFLDTNGNEIIPIIYDQIELMNDCPYLCAIIEESSYKYKKGVFRLDGTIVIPVKYEFILVLWNKENSNYYFQTSDYYKHGIYNSKGKEIIPTEAANIKLINFKNVDLFKVAFERIYNSNKDFDNFTKFKIFTKEGIEFYPYASDEEIYFEPTDRYPEPIGIGIKLHNEKDLYSLYDENGNILFNYQKIIPIKDKNTSYYPDNIYNQYIVRCKGKEGIYNSIQGCLTIPIIYESIDVINSNTFIVRKEKKYGVLGDNNKTIIPVEFDYIKFDYNCYFVSLENNKGVYNIEGENIIPVEYENIITPYIHQIFLIKNNGKWGVYENSNLIALTIYDHIDIIIYEDKQFYRVRQNGLYNILDNNGRKIFDRESEYRILFLFNEENFINDISLPYIYIKNYLGIIIQNFNNTYSLYNEKGQLLIENLDFQFGRECNNNDFITFSQKGKIGLFCLSKNQIVLPAIYESIRPIKKQGWSQKAIVQYGKNQGVYDYDGKEVVPTKYDILEQIYGFECKFNYLFAYINNKMGILSENGETIIPTEYELIERFNITINYSEQTNCLFTIIKNQKRGLFNLENKYFIPTIYDSIQWLKTFNLDAETFQTHYKVIKDKKQGIITENNETIISTKYDKIDYFCNYHTTLAIISNHNKLGVFYGKEILIPTIYDEIKPIFINGIDMFKVKEDNKYGIINLKGQTVVFCKFDSIEYEHSLFYAKNNNIISIINLNGEILFKEIKDIKFFTTSTYKLTKTNNKNILCNHKFRTISPEVDEIKLFTNNISNTLYYLIKNESFWGICRVLEEEYEYILPCSYVHIEHHLINNSIIFIIQTIDNKYGVYNNNSKEIIPAIYDKIELHSTNNIYYYKVYQNEFVGICSYNGETIIPASYHQINVLIENDTILYYKVIKENLIGFYSHEGKMIIHPYIQEVKELNTNNKKAFIIKINEYYGILYNNKITIDTIYDNITLADTCFAYTHLEVIRNNKVGLFNINGEQLIPTLYDKIIRKSGYYLIKLDSLWGIYIINNNNIISPQYEEYKAYTDFLFVKKDNLWSIYFCANEIYSSTIEYIEIWRDEDGDNCPAYYDIKYLFILIKSKKGYGIINKWGKTIIPDIYDEIGIIKEKRPVEVNDDYYYSDNYTYDITFKVKLKGLWGFYNEKGIEIYPTIFNDINNIDTEGSGIIKEGELWGYMYKCKIILPTIFNSIEYKLSSIILKINQLDNIYDISTKSYPILHKLKEEDIWLRNIYLYSEKEHQWRIINGIGKEECPPFPYNSTIYFTELDYYGVIIIEIEGKVGVYSSNGLELVPPIYKSFKGKKEIGLTTYFIMQDFNNKYGCTTNSFQKKDVKIPFIYDYILKGNSKIHFYVKKDNKILGLNENGEILSEKELKIYNLSLGYEFGIFEDDINRKTL